MEELSTFDAQNSEHDDDYEGNEGDDQRSSIFQMDYRIMWIRDRVLTFLDLPGHEYLFYQFINENDRFYEDKLLNFLILDLHGVTNLERKVVCFYKTYTCETFQEEVSVWEKNTHGNKSATQTSTTKGKGRRLTKSAPGKVEKLDDKKKIKKIGKKTKKIKGKLSKVDSTPVSSNIDFSIETLRSGQESIQTGFSEEEIEDEEEEDEEMEDFEEEEEGMSKNEDEEEGGRGDFSFYSRKKGQSKSAPTDSVSFVPPVGEEDKYILTKKMVERVRKTPVLQMICGELDGSRTDLQDVMLYYFLRTKDEGVPPFDTYEECLEEITSYLIVGSLNGKFLVSLNKILVQVFRPLVENQFRGPRFLDRLKFEDTPAEAERSSIEKATANLNDIIESRNSVLRRPSEYRRISLVIEKREARLSSKSENVGEINETDSPASPARKTTNSQGETKLSRTNLTLPTQRVSSKSTMSVKGIEKAPPMDQNKNDILAYLDKLISNVEWTLEHVEGDILLTMPRIPEFNDPAVTDDMLEKNKEVITKLEDVTMSWGAHIQKILDSFTTKVAQGKDPISECLYWQDRETGLTMLVEQLRTPMAKRILELLNKTLSPIASNFEYFYADLWKYYAEARDNNRFLETVLRYFQLITHSDSMKAITEAIPSLTEGLRMIWVLSNYYSSEEKMLLLLQRISWQLCQTVKRNLSIDELFKKPLEQVLETTREAHTLLKSWKLSYLKTREDIEVSGKGSRWEFDQKLLFQGTEYIATVCSGLKEIASVLEDFYNIFGPDLKSIINDPAQIDTIIKRVDRLILPIQEADFNIFDDFNKENWDATMAWFYEEVHFLENEAKFFIDECFMVLISAEHALEMLLKFKNIKTRATIRQQLLKKFDIIMQQFSKEISAVENIYNRGKRNPPLLTYHPPMAGAIFWVRQLFHRLRRPVLILQNIPELKHSELKLLAFSQYLDIAKQMKTFEEAKFNSWIDKAQFLIVNTMKKSVLQIIQFVCEKGVAPSPDKEKLVQTKNLHTIHVSKKVKTKNLGSITSTPQGSVQRVNALISKVSTETSSSVAVGSRIVSTKDQPRSDTKADSKGLFPLQKDQRTSTMSSLVDKQGSHGVKITWPEFMSNSILVECQLHFRVNFDWEIFEIIHEAELMEQLGFELPTIVRDVCIQKDRLRGDIEATEKMINQYNGIVDKMDKADIGTMFRLSIVKIEDVDAAALDA